MLMLPKHPYTSKGPPCGGTRRLVFIQWKQKRWPRFLQHRGHHICMFPSGQRSVYFTAVGQIQWAGDSITKAITGVDKMTQSMRWGYLVRRQMS